MGGKVRKMFNKILWIDIESTGLLFNKHGIIQIAGIIEINGEVKEKFQIFNNPIGKTIDEGALKINGYSVERLQGFMHPRNNYEGIIKMFSKYVDKFDKSDKFIAAGHNVCFDIEFLLQFFKDNNDNYFFSWVESRAYLDTRYIANFLQHTKKLPVLENSKLETLSKHFEEDTAGLHNAMFDIEHTRAIYYKMLDLIIDK